MQAFDLCRRCLQSMGSIPLITEHVFDHYDVMVIVVLSQPLDRKCLKSGIETLSIGYRLGMHIAQHAIQIIKRQAGFRGDQYFR